MQFYITSLSFVQAPETELNSRIQIYTVAIIGQYNTTIPLFNCKLILELNDLFHYNIINQCKSTYVSIEQGTPQKARPVLKA